MSSFPSNDTGIEGQILQAAYEVFVEKGFDSAKMQDIANKAGIARTVLNYYFRTKNALYQHIAKQILQLALPQILSTLNSDLAFDLKIEKFVDQYIELALKHPFMPLFIVNELHALGPEFVTQMLGGQRPNLDPFLAHVKAEIQAGRMRNVDPLQVPLHVLGLCAFPFLGKPMLQIITGVDDVVFRQLMQQRKQEVYTLITRGLAP